MNDPKPTIRCNAFPPLSTALKYIAEEGLQAPSSCELGVIIQHGLLATMLLYDCSLLEPSNTDLEEFFGDFVLRSVNRTPGLGDVAAD